MREIRTSGLTRGEAGAKAPLPLLYWFLIKLLVCDAVAFFASIEVYGYYPVISTTKNIASSL